MKISLKIKVKLNFLQCKSFERNELQSNVTEMQNDLVQLIDLFPQQE